MAEEYGSETDLATQFFLLLNWRYNLIVLSDDPTGWVSTYQDQNSPQQTRKVLEGIPQDQDLFLSQSAPPTSRPPLSNFLLI